MSSCHPTGKHCYVVPFHRWEHRRLRRRTQLRKDLVQGWSQSNKSELLHRTYPQPVTVDHKLYPAGNQNNQDKKERSLITKGNKSKHLCGLRFVFTFQLKTSIFSFPLRNCLPNTNDKSSRKGNAIFKFLGGHHKQWRFYKLALDSLPLPDSRPTHQHCVLATLKTPGYGNERWPLMESKEKHVVSKKKCVVRSERCGNSLGYSIHEFSQDSRAEDKQPPAESPHHKLLRRPGDKYPSSWFNSMLICFPV